MYQSSHFFKFILKRCVDSFYDEIGLDFTPLRADTNAYYQSVAIISLGDKSTVTDSSMDKDTVLKFLASDLILI